MDRTLNDLLNFLSQWSSQLAWVLSWEAPVRRSASTMPRLFPEFDFDICELAGDPNCSGNSFPDSRQGPQVDGRCKASSHRPPTRKPTTVEAMRNRERHRATYDELKSLLAIHAEDFLRDLPPLETLVPAGAKDADGFARLVIERSAIVRAIQEKFISRASSASGAALPMDPVSRAVETISAFFDSEPELRDAKAAAVIKKCRIARQPALKALHLLAQSGKYNGHMRPKKRPG